MTKRIGVLTGGGDCPGLNAVIRGITKGAITQYGMEVYGIKDGFLGLTEGAFMPLTSNSVSGILTQGGTILGTSNRDDPFAKQIQRDGETVFVDVSERCVDAYERQRLEALICLGGDGTLTIAGKLAEKGLNVIGVPKTIDRDLLETETTFGYNSALTMATDAIDRLHTTADAHHRVMLVEVMGRNAGWLALEAGIAGGGDIILIPEIPYAVAQICEAIRQRNRQGKRFSIIVVAEGARPAGGAQIYQCSAPGSIARLGGCAQQIAAQVQDATGTDCRVAVLGHLQRGGSPTAFDRLLATRFAIQALELVADRQFNQMVCLKADQTSAVPIRDVMGRQRLVPLDCQQLRTAAAVGTSFGAVLPG